MTVQEDAKAIESALKKLDDQRINFGMLDRFDVDENHAVTKALEEVKLYRILGTVEELKEAREKQVAKKPNIVGGEFIKLAECSECNTVIRFKQEYCHKCGNKVNWEEGAENE